MNWYFISLNLSGGTEAEAASVIMAVSKAKAQKILLDEMGGHRFTIVGIVEHNSLEEALDQHKDEVVGTNKEISEEDMRQALTRIFGIEPSDAAVKEWMKRYNSESSLNGFNEMISEQYDKFKAFAVARHKQNAHRFN